MSILDLAGNQIVSDTLADSGLDWKVELSHNLIAPTASTEAYTTNRRATVRTDTNEVLGIVGPDYKIVQNQELVYMAERIANNDSLKVTSAGELRNGARVWLAVEASSFNVGNADDPIKPYLLLTNGHDGLYSLSATPTSVRPWCENTLNMAMSEGKAAGHCISIRHKGNMEDKIDDLTTTMINFYQRTEEFQKQANYLASCNMTSGDVANYFDNAYNKVVKNVPVYTDIKNDSDRRAYNKKQSTVMKFWQIFDNESTALGSNAWIAFNAMTNWMDHDASFRGENKLENKFSANFYGSNANKKQKLLEYTLSNA
tara:strand:+ start:851 stop:1792 length:942 start_codon:yes stop_codon:yes gene_type:complete